MPGSEIRVYGFHIGADEAVVGVKPEPKLTIFPWDRKVSLKRNTHRNVALSLIRLRIPLSMVTLQEGEHLVERCAEVQLPRDVAPGAGFGNGPLAVGEQRRQQQYQQE